MEDEEDEKKKKKKQKYFEHPDHHHRQHQQQHINNRSTSDLAFKLSSEVKGLRFGGQFIVKSFTVRQATPLQFLNLLSINYHHHHHSINFPNNNNEKHQLSFPSTTAFLPTNFTILAHHAWHTLTLGLGTKNSKVLIFVFESDAMKLAVDRIWPAEIALGEVNKKLIRGLTGCEMARLKFRKGCLTFYVYAVRQVGVQGFQRADDLRTVLQSVVALKDFLDHTAMLALPTQRNITFSSPVAMAY